MSFVSIFSCKLVRIGLLLLLFAYLQPTSSHAQGFDTLCITTYNLLNYPGSTSAIRNPEYRKIVRGISPDLLVVQEMSSSSGLLEFYNNVLDVVSPSAFSYVPFNDGPDTDNSLYYRTSKWEYVSASYIPTALRNIAEYVLRPLNSTEQLRVYSVHLKSSSGSANEQLRLNEATILRNHLNSLPAGTNFIIVGDYNIYSSNEPAFQKLIGSETNNNGRSTDPLNLTGNWSSNPSIAMHHTQSPRVRQFEGGANGGMDDRFDIILTSSSMSSRILPSSYKAYGNDGNHYNDSINRLPNAAVPDSIANAIHNASDHLPVMAQFVFPRNVVPIQLAYLRAGLNATRDSVVLRWMTISETNNFGFEVERRNDTTSSFTTAPNSFVPGNGTTLEPRYYSFAEAVPSSGNWQYRLRQIDLDGEVHLTEIVHLQITTSVAFASMPEAFSLSQNFPNPFNPSTIIRFSVSSNAIASIEVFNVLGQRVAVLHNSEVQANQEYSVQFDARDDFGNSLASGIYFYRLVANQAASQTLVSKMYRMVLLR